MTQAHLNVKIDIQCTRKQFSSHVIFLGVVGNHCFNRVSHKHTKLASEALLLKTKNSNKKMLPPVVIEPGTSDSKSDTLLSELAWHPYSIDSRLIIEV